jgi:hypothetical protein
MVRDSVVYFSQLATSAAASASPDLRAPLLSFACVDLHLFRAANFWLHGDSNTCAMSDIGSDLLKWVDLSWIRCAIDGVTAALSLWAASKPDDIY